MMKSIKKHTHLDRIVSRLREAKGDTLVETLCAILVAAAAAVVLTTGVSTSANITHDAKVADEKLNAAREAAAEQDIAHVLGHGEIEYTWKEDGAVVDSTKKENANFFGGHLNDEHSSGIYSYSGVWS